MTPEEHDARTAKILLDLVEAEWMHGKQEEPEPAQEQEWEMPLGVPR